MPSLIYKCLTKVLTFIKMTDTNTKIKILSLYLVYKQSNFSNLNVTFQLRPNISLISVKQCCRLEIFIYLIYLPYLLHHQQQELGEDKAHGPALKKNLLNFNFVTAKLNENKSLSLNEPKKYDKLSISSLFSEFFFYFLTGHAL